MAIKCRIFWDCTLGGYVVSSSYNDKFINGLKYVIPASERHFDSATKLWHLTENYGQVVKNIAETMFSAAEVSFVSKQVAEQARASQRSAPPPPVVGVMLAPLDKLLLEFMRLLPYEAARAAFRTAATSMHPDKQSGDATKMADLNAFWNQISREVYGK